MDASASSCIATTRDLHGLEHAFQLLCGDQALGVYSLSLECATGRVGQDVANFKREFANLQRKFAHLKRGSAYFSQFSRFCANFSHNGPI